MKKIFSNKYLVILFSITIIKIILSSFLPSISFNVMKYDDVLMLNLSDYLSSILWLGPYTSDTLIKGMFYPFLLSIIDSSIFLYSFSFTIIYTLSTVYFCYSLNTIIKNKKIIYIIYLLLLLNPVSVSVGLFQRLYRNTLYLSQTLFLLGSILLLINSRKANKIVINGLTLGLVIGTILLTREDYFWIYPILFIYFIFVLLNKKINIKSKLLMIFMPILMCGLIVNAVSYKNYKMYGIYTTNELSNSNFKKMFLSIMSIDTDEEIYRVAITKNMYDEAIKYSKTFKDLVEYNYEEIFTKSSINGQIPNYLYIWSFRRMIYDNKKVDSKDLNEKFLLVYNELESAFKDNKLKRKNTFSSIFLIYPNKTILKELPRDFIRVLYYTSSYKDVMSVSSKQIDFSPYASEVYKPDGKNDITYLYVSDFNKSEIISDISYTDINSGLFNIISLIYKIFNPFICILGFISYLYVIFNHKKYKKCNNELIFITSLLITSLVILLGVSYTNASSFDSIRYIYLAPVYLLELIFNINSIYLFLRGKVNEKSRFNCIASLLK